MVKGMWFHLKNKCDKRHILFERVSNGSYKAIDTWCGHVTVGKVWYCSDECLRNGKEGLPLEYEVSDDETISND